MVLNEHPLQLDDRVLSYAVGPACGPPLLLLHGVTRRWQTFLPVLPQLIQRWQVFALDFRGHGRSGPSNQGYRVIDYLDDARLMLQRVISGPVVVYGHSLGSMVAAALGAESPRVAGTILEDPPLHAMGERIRETSLHSLFCGIAATAEAGLDIPATAARLADVEVTDPAGGPTVRLAEVRDAASLRFSAGCLQHVDLSVFSPITEGQWLDGYDVDAIFSSLRSPTLLLQADPDAGGMLSDDDAAHAESLCSDCLRVRFADTPHSIHWESTQRLLNVAVAFLEPLRDEMAE